jgi:hypothetical protein
VVARRVGFVSGSPLYPGALQSGMTGMSSAVGVADDAQAGSINPDVEELDPWPTPS